MISSQKERKNIFISYSHQDEKWLKRLHRHLKHLEINYGFDIWDDTKIDAGSKWKENIRKAIDSAKVAVCLISADFLISDFIVKNELPPLLSAAENEGTMILPLIVSPCMFEETESLSQFQAVNSPSKTLIGLSKVEQEQLFVKLTKIIETLLKENNSHKTAEFKAPAEFNFKIEYSHLIVKSLKNLGINETTIDNYIKSYYSRHKKMFEFDFNTELVSIVGSDYFLMMSKDQNTLIIHDFGIYTSNIELFEKWITCVEAHHKIMSLPYRENTSSVLLKKKGYEFSTKTFESAISELHAYYSNTKIMNENITFLLNGARTNIANCTKYYYDFLNDDITFDDALKQIIVKFETAATLIHKVLLDYPFSVVTSPV